MSVCKGCGAPLPPEATAKRIWCSERCRKKQYDRWCVDCGGKCNGSSGLNRLATRCYACAIRRNEVTKRWTRERIVEVIQVWAREHGGIPPSATDWHRGGRPRWAPATSEVLRVWGSWGDAVQAAGFPRPRRGRPEGRRST